MGNDKIHRISDDLESNNRSKTSKSFGYYITDKWADMYPGQQVAIVTSVGQAPNPPPGFVPHRAGQTLIARSATTKASNSAREIISLDTVEWSEHHLEQRLLQMSGWATKPHYDIFLDMQQYCFFSIHKYSRDHLQNSIR